MGPLALHPANLHRNPQTAPARQTHYRHLNSDTACNIREPLGIVSIFGIRYMTDFLDTLKTRRDAARERLTEARKNVAAAEAEFKKWSDAFDLEQRSTGQNPTDGGGEAIERLKTLTIDSVRRKEDILRTALREAKRPLKPSEILKMVKPALSRSSVYYLVNILRASGELDVIDGKFILASQEKKAGQD